MDAQEAIRQAQAHLKNALELVPRPIGKEELLYMWDNQITALDNFLADTEALADEQLKDLRRQLLEAKKKLMQAVMAFEAQQEGVELEEDEPEAEEWVATYTEMAGEVLGVVQEALEETVRDVKELVKWEEPLAMVNGYLADSEPYQEISKDLRRARSLVRVARRDLKARIEDVFDQWKKADMKAGRDDED